MCAATYEGLKDEHCVLTNMMCIFKVRHPTCLPPKGYTGIVPKIRGFNRSMQAPWSPIHTKHHPFVWLIDVVGGVCFIWVCK